jgi:hypothetical protein
LCFQGPTVPFAHSLHRLFSDENSSL